MFDSDATFVVGGGLAFSKGRWDTPPLVAQQLIWGQHERLLDLSAYTDTVMTDVFGPPRPE